MTDYTPADIDRAADVLINEQSGGYCHLGRICGLCDCYLKYQPDSLEFRDSGARHNVISIIKALEGK